MKIHILGICGTFMGSLALLARQCGHDVTGSDANVYPPMSTLLAEQGIELMEGYDAAHLKPEPDCVVIGNTIKRGNLAVEFVLKRGLNYQSGPQWLAENVLQDKWVLAVSGTHGKTTASSMLAWILESAGMNPGFLIGGVPENFGVSARLTDSPFFVIEADEYDSAFFDKRSKFIHYHPRSLIINNIEFDHADIFPDLDAIKNQFHNLIKTIPSNGLIVYPAADENVKQTINKGCWTPTVDFGFNQSAWQIKNIAENMQSFEIAEKNKIVGKITWKLMGRHNISNALAAVIAAKHVGVKPDIACDALANFQSVKRRMQVTGQVRGITVYDDFAHHPTAIASTIEGLRAIVGKQRIIAIIEFASNTMRSGLHSQQVVADSLKQADQIIMLKPKGTQWQLQKFIDELDAKIYTDVSEIVESLKLEAKSGDHLLVMSNKSFDGIHQRLLEVF